MHIFGACDVCSWDEQKHSNRESIMSFWISNHNKLLFNFYGVKRICSIHKWILNTLYFKLYCWISSFRKPSATVFIVTLLHWRFFFGSWPKCYFMLCSFKLHLYFWTFKGCLKRTRTPQYFCYGQEPVVHISIG